METTSQLEKGGKYAKRHPRVIPPRDRAADWEQSATVSSSTFSRNAAPQKDSGTKFLRLLNQRALLLAFVVGAMWNLASGNLRAQSQPQPPNQFTRLDDIPATQNTVSITVPCHTATPQEFIKVLTNLGLHITAIGDGFSSISITGNGIDVRCATTALMALDNASDLAPKKIELFPLKYADAGEMATLLNDVFAAYQRTPGRLFAKADVRAQTLVVTAPNDLFPIVRDLLQKLDQPTEDITEVQVFHLRNADCVEMAKLLTNLFPTPDTTNAAAYLVRFGTTSPSNMDKKMALVSAVPDPRTQSLVVAASKDMMPQLEDMIESLDDTPPSPRAASRSVMQDGPTSNSSSILNGHIGAQTNSNPRNPTGF